MTYLIEKRYVRRDFVALLVMSSLFPAFQGLVQTLLPLRLAHMGLDKTTIGLIQALPGLMVLLLGAPLAQLANTRWRRAALIGSFGLSILACLLYGIADGALGIIAPQFLFGLASCSFWSNMLTSSFRLAEDAEQRRIQGLITAVQGIGFFGGPIIGGYLSRFSYAYGFYAAAICSVGGLIAGVRLSPAQAIEPSRGFLRDWVASYGRLWRVMTQRPSILLGAAFVFMSCSVLYVMGGSFFLLYASQLGLSAMISSALMSGREVLASLVRLQFGAVSRRVPPVALVGGGICVGALFLAALPCTRTALGLGVIALGVGGSLAFMPPAVNMISGASAAPREQTYGMVSTNLASFAAQTTMAPILGMLLSATGYRTAYPLMAAVWVTLAVVILRLALRIERRRETESVQAGAQRLRVTADYGPGAES